MFTNGGIKTDFSRSLLLRNGTEIILILVALNLHFVRKTSMKRPAKFYLPLPYCNENGKIMFFMFIFFKLTDVFHYLTNYFNIWSFSKNTHLHPKSISRLLKDIKHLLLTVICITHGLQFKKTIVI